MKSIRKWWWVSLIILLVVAIAGFVIWAETPLGPDPIAQAAMLSNARVQVSEDGWITFEPVQSSSDKGLILYPGGRVDPRSYAPTAQAIASQGYLVIIAKMPLNLAVFNPDLAREIISAYPQVTTWLVGGHSLGGSMAARFVASNIEIADGLFMWASYPASNDDLSSSDIKVASMYGTLDGLLDPSKMEESRSLLPQDTMWTVIKGGNHAQFGWYGPQPGDYPASISHLEQQEVVVQETLELLSAVK
jgi:pimeloyl-ACP methyl ester carboxylesterase